MPPLFSSARAVADDVDAAAVLGGVHEPVVVGGDGGGAALGDEVADLAGVGGVAVVDEAGALAVERLDQDGAVPDAGQRREPVRRTVGIGLQPRAADRAPVADDRQPERLLGGGAPALAVVAAGQGDDQQPPGVGAG